MVINHTKRRNTGNDTVVVETTSGSNRKTIFEVWLSTIIVWYVVVFVKIGSIQLPKVHPIRLDKVTDRFIPAEPNWFYFH